MRLFNSTASRFILGFASIIAASFLCLALIGALEWGRTEGYVEKTAAPLPK